MSKTAKRIESVCGRTAAPLLDLRFASRLGPDRWAALPPAIRRRFSKRIGPGCAMQYNGRIEHTYLNFPGRLLAQLLRFIGAPLPLDPNNTGRNAVVIVTDAPDGSGQCWTRRYDRSGGRAAQTIASTKRFIGPTGCAE